MSGSIEGGLKAARTNKARYGKDYYKVQGAKGGAAGHTGGFYANRELASIAGAKGGRLSSRAGVKSQSKFETLAPVKQSLWNKLRRSI